MGEALAMVEFAAPLIVLLVAVGAVLKFAHGLVLTLLGRAPSEEPVRPSTGVGRFLGRAVSRLLHPFEQGLRIVSALLFLAVVFLTVDRLRLWDDGLVDAEARVSAIRTVCAPLDSLDAQVPVATSCPTPIPAGQHTIEVADLTVVGADGFDVVATVSTARIGRGVAVGEIVAYAHPLGQPQKFDRHLHQHFGMGGWVLLAVAAAVRGTAIAIGAIRSGLSGARENEGRSLFDGGASLRRSRGGDPADLGPDMPGFGFGTALARVGLDAAMERRPAQRALPRGPGERETIGRWTREDAPRRER